MNTRNDSPEAAAARLLSLRAMSSHDLEAALLRRGFPEQSVRETVTSLLEHRILDDSLYAEQLLHHYTRRGYGKPYIAAKMREHGLDDSVISDALRDFSADSAILDALALKHLRRDSSEVGVRRTLAALVRRGYSVSDSRDAISRVLADSSVQDDPCDDFSDFT